MIWFIVYILTIIFTIGIIVIDIKISEEEDITKGDLLLILFIGFVPVLNSIVLLATLHDIFKRSLFWRRLKAWLNEPIHKNSKHNK